MIIVLSAKLRARMTFEVPPNDWSRSAEISRLPFRTSGRVRSKGNKISNGSLAGDLDIVRRI